MSKLYALADYLCWDGSNVNTVRDWISPFEDLLTSKFETISSVSEYALAFRAGLQLLGDNYKIRFLRDPRSAHILLGYSHSTKNASLPLIAGILAEYLSCSGSGACSESEITPYNIKNQLKLLRLENNLDMDSTFVIPWISNDVTNVVSVPRDQKELVSRKICESVNMLCEFNEEALLFVASFTSRLLVRSEPARPTSFSSCSFGRYPGLTLLINVDHDNIDTAQVVDALVHEAIHSAIFVSEALGEPLVVEPIPAEKNLRSPWSGNMLYIDQYAEACFVWWGLANLWEGVAQTFCKNAIQCKKLSARARSGFSKDPINPLLHGEMATWITPEGREALSRIRELSFP